MRILFVVKSIDFIDPLGPAYISAVAKQKGHETQLAIMDRENVLDRIKSWSPDIIAYSSVTGEHRFYMELNKEVKKKFKVFTVMGGAHPTFYPECLEKSALDAICMGEGEGAFADLLDSIESRRDLGTIPNIKTHNGSGNGVRELIPDLDSLPFPDRDLFLKNTELGKFPIKNFMASRGCPYPCTYCFNHALQKLYTKKGKYLRRYSVDRLIDEILYIKSRYALEFIKFEDDLFITKTNIDWLREFTTKYKQKVNLPFNVLGRCDIINEDIVRLLKEAGCKSVTMSIDSGNERLRREVLKRNMTDEQIVTSFNLLKRYDLNIMSNNILALPYSAFENEVESIDLNIKSSVSYGMFSILMPYPKTGIGEYCRKEGLMDIDVDEYPISLFSKSPLSCFTEAEKNVQKNILELGPLAIWWPSLKTIILKYLVHLPHNRLYTLIGFVFKAYMMKTKIYPVKLRPKEYLTQFIKGIRIEMFRSRVRNN